MPSKNEYEIFFRNLQSELGDFGFGTDDEVNGSDLVEFMGMQFFIMETIARKSALFTDAYEGLREYYPRDLTDQRQDFYREKVFAHFESGGGLSGNDQADYEKMRDLLESSIKEFYSIAQASHDKAAKTINEQGWDTYSQLIHCEGFIARQNLEVEFAEYVANAAKEENDDAAEVLRESNEGQK